MLHAYLSSNSIYDAVLYLCALEFTFHFLRKDESDEYTLGIIQSFLFPSESIMSDISDLKSIRCSLPHLNGGLTEIKSKRARKLHPWFGWRGVTGTERN